MNFVVHDSSWTLKFDNFLFQIVITTHTHTHTYTHTPARALCSKIDMPHPLVIIFIEQRKLIKVTETFHNKNNFKYPDVVQSQLEIQKTPVELTIVRYVTRCPHLSNYLKKFAATMQNEISNQQKQPPEVLWEKTLSLKILQNSQENNCPGVSFLIKL